MFYDIRNVSWSLLHCTWVSQVLNWGLDPPPPTHIRKLERIILLRPFPICIPQSGCANLYTVLIISNSFKVNFSKSSVKGKGFDHQWWCTPDYMMRNLCCELSSSSKRPFSRPQTIRKDFESYDAFVCCTLRIS